MRVRSSLVILGLLASGVSAGAATPPIACRAARTDVEHAICDSPEYLAMDREIAALFDRGLILTQGVARHALVERQRAFVRQRASCAWAAHHSAHPGVAVDECIRTIMEVRAGALRRFIGIGP